MAFEYKKLKTQVTHISNCIAVLNAKWKIINQEIENTFSVFTGAGTTRSHVDALLPVIVSTSGLWENVILQHADSLKKLKLELNDFQSWIESKFVMEIVKLTANYSKHGQDQYLKELYIVQKAIVSDINNAKEHISAKFKSMESDQQQKLPLISDQTVEYIHKLKQALDVV